MSNLVILTLLVLVAPLALCDMNMDTNTVAYNATGFSDDSSPESIAFTGYLDKETDTFYWNFNLTKATAVTSLEIRDGKAGMDVSGKELQVFSTPFNGTKTFSGNFSEGINPAVAANAIELANHMCMGHIYAVVTENGTDKRAAINYNPKESGIMDCYAAVGLQGGHMDMPGMEMDMDMPGMEMDMDMPGMDMPGMEMDTSEAMADAPEASNSAGIRSTFVIVMVTLAAVLC